MIFKVFRIEMPRFGLDDVGGQVQHVLWNLFIWDIPEVLVAMVTIPQWMPLIRSSIQRRTSTGLGRSRADRFPSAQASRSLPRAVACTACATRKATPARSNSSRSAITPPDTGREMSSIVSTDTIIRISPGETPDYNSDNPLVRLLGYAEAHRLAAGRHYYLTDELHVPFSHLTLAGPQGSDSDVLDPTRQDNKSDFQKQNIRDFLVTDTYLLRGWVTAQAWDKLEDLRSEE